MVATVAGKCLVEPFGGTYSFPEKFQSLTCGVRGELWCVCEGGGQTSPMAFRDDVDEVLEPCPKDAFPKLPVSAASSFFRHWCSSRFNSCTRTTVKAGIYKVIPVMLKRKIEK